MHVRVATAAALVWALAAVPTAGAQAPDTTAPTVTVGNTPSAPAQRNGDPVNAVAPTSTSTGNGNWFIAPGVTLQLSAADNVGVTRLEYSLDNGATYVSVPVTGGSTTPITNEGPNTVRVRAFDAAGNNVRGTAANTTLNQAAAAGATDVRLTSTTNRAVNDEVVFEPGTANEETLRIKEFLTGTSPAPNVRFTTALTKAHAANAAVTTYPQFRSVAVNIDSRMPTATMPASVVNNRIGHGAANISPTRSDPTPGSGGTAIREAWLDGTWVYPLPLDASKLSLGKHSWTLLVTDNAGNGNKVTYTFLVVTSIADLDAMLAKWGTAGTVASATVTDLRAKVAEAKTAADASDNAGAIEKLEQLRGMLGSVTNADARNTLISDINDVQRQLRGIPDAAAPSDLGVTQVASAGQPRHLYVPPGPPVRNANPQFKILVVANKQDGSFRHPAIEDAEVMLQQLGQQKNFDVDIWDPQYPNSGPSDTPFTSAVNLAQYKVIVGDSSVGNNTFNAAYRMKDGTIVDEQAAFEGFIRNGGGYVVLHAANDSMHNWPFYKGLIGGLFVNHPSNQGGFGTDCGSCYWAELSVEDYTHPSTVPAGQPRVTAIADELYHFDRKPRLDQHVLATLNEDTYKTAMGVSANPANQLENGDHPITYCSNYAGGRSWSQVLGHNWELYKTPWFRESVYQGLLTAGNLKYANCVTHAEVKTLLSDLQASGGITAATATQGTALVQSAFDKYFTLDKAQIGSSIGDLNALRDLANNPASGDAVSRAKLLTKAQELKSWMQTLLGAQDVGGTAFGSVPATLALSIGSAPAFGAFTPGLGKTYTASSSANVISTAGDATLSVLDPSANATGRLVNGAFSLTAPLQAAATSAAGVGTALANVGGSSAPTNLLTYGGPVSNDSVTLNFSQAIGANEPLRTGTYSKTLTFTLSTTTP